MKVIQIANGYKKGQGVGNVVIVLDELLKKNGYEASIYDSWLEEDAIDIFSEDTIAFYHLSLDMDPYMKRLPCKKVLVFHNITEPGLLDGTYERMKTSCAAGLYEAGQAAEYFDYAIVFSKYSKRCLVERGWIDEKIYVLPIEVRLHKFNAKPDEQILLKYQNDDYVNILFTGRVYPNKKQEDIIAAFAAYKEKYNSKSRLFLVGSVVEGNYYPSLLAYIEKLGIAQNVIFSGFVTFEEYLAYYHVADLYICMSAHEGFCIPLVEAMYFNLPIIAHNSTAVPETLSGAGELLNTRNPEKVAAVMNRILCDEEYKKKICDGQAKRLQDLRPEPLEGRYIECVSEIISRFQSMDHKSVKKQNKYEFTLENNISLKIKAMKQSEDKERPWVIYGAGGAGIKLYSQLKKVLDKNNLHLCDKYKAGQYSDKAQCEILSPDEVLELYHDGWFIVSVQDTRVLIDTISLLNQYGVKADRIYAYDVLDNSLV